MCVCVCFMITDGFGREADIRRCAMSSVLRLFPHTAHDTTQFFFCYFNISLDAFLPLG